jgi:trigger factor
MNVTIEDVSACRKRLKIEVPANRVNQTFEEVTDEFQRFAKIPGFRPGKAPRAVIQKRYQKDIEEELQRKLVPQAYREAVQARNLKPVSAPEIEDLKFQAGLSLSFTTVVDLAPDFAVPLYRGLSVKAVDTVVTEEDVTKTLDSIREQRAEFKEVEPRPLAMEDFAVISYVGSLGGKPIAEIVPEAKSVGENPQFWLWMRPNLFLPNFVEQIVGLKVGETKTIEIEFPADFGQKALAGQKASYEVTLKEIKVREMPEWTEELAQELAKRPLAELKEEVKKDLENRKKEEANRAQKKELVEQLLASSKFELPESVVREETEGVMYDIVSENQARGVPVELLEEKKQEIYDNASHSAKDMVKLNFILTKIAEAEQIKVTNEEVAQQVQMMAMQRQQPIEKLIKVLQKNNAFPQIERRILSQKVMDFLLQAAKVS